MHVLKEIKMSFNEDYDVIVAGGGPAGCAAAAASAREGAKTLIIENAGALGGLGTIGLIPAWCPFSDGERILHRGIAEKVFKNTVNFMPHIPKDALDWVAIDNEALKIVYDNLMDEYGVDVLFHSLLSGAEVDGSGNVQAVYVSNKAGISAYKARTYVDCTGDADLCAYAGGIFQENDDIMPATLCFVLSNVDEAAYLKFRSISPNPFIKIKESGEYNLITSSHCCSHLIGRGTVGFNAGHLWNSDAKDPKSVSDAMIKGRRQARQYLEALGKYFPDAFKKAYLVSTADLIGIRESRRIYGDYILTLDDYLNRRSFKDEISRNAYFVDMHLSKKQEELKDDGKLKNDPHQIKYNKGESHGIPYRCLLPKNLKNVIAAGRIISCERMVLASVRTMPSCLSMGEAAGMAAALSAHIENGDVRGISVEHLRTRLAKEGVYIH